MTRALTLVLALAVGLMLAAVPAAAQQAAPGAGAGQEAPSMIEGTVSGVDWGAGKLTIGGVAGFLGTELLVSPQTKITSKQNEQLSIRDIRQGDVIRARYRKVGDQNMATSIAVLHSRGTRPQTEGGGSGQAGQGAP